MCTNRLHSARTNVEKNGLLPKIDLRLVRSDGRVLIDALKVIRATPHFHTYTTPQFLFNVNSTLLSVYRALFGVYRALLNVNRALLNLCAQQEHDGTV